MSLGLIAAASPETGPQSAPQGAPRAGASTLAGGRGAELCWFGRATTKIRTATGLVIYIDPFAPGDYSEPADLVLVTHGHGDHNQVGLVPRKQGALLVAPPGAVDEKGARTVKEGELVHAGGVEIRVLPAGNKNHKRGETVGYILSFDGIVVYHAGDTDYLPEMADWGRYGIAYALLPCDGFYNMGPAEASRCALAMGAKRVIPIHSSKDGLVGEKNARAVTGAEVIVLAPGQKLALRP
jgi:L-ascorbate metabolism protein UlaG (beta-lactamase superfamily)